MSFLQYMMGRGLRRGTCENPAGADELLHSILARRSMSTVDSDVLTAQLANDAERRGDIASASERYAAVTRNKLVPRWALQRAACVAAVRGDYSAAANLYESIADGSPRTGFIRGHLLLAAKNPQGASRAFGETLARLLGAEFAEYEAGNTETFDEIAQVSQPRPEDSGCAEIELLLDESDTLLKAGRYVRARDTLEKALSTVDLLMSGQAGWVVAETRNAADSPQAGAALIETLVPLVAMSDLLLRLLARTCLASNLAEALRARQLREDLAVWASGKEEINELLLAERTRIQRAAVDHPDHAELHYHLGLVCRALGDLPAAEAAFRCVLAVCPNYTRAAVRLAVTLRQSGRGEQAPAVLDASFNVSPDTLGQYYRLGLATTDVKRFDRSVETMAHGLNAARRPDAKANLALALAQIGLLDNSRREWKESTAAVSGTTTTRE